MIATRLVRLIETHADALAMGMLERCLNCPQTSDLHKVPRAELRERAYEIYRDLSGWLLTKTESDIEHCYSSIGGRRAAQGVSLSHLVYGILLVKEHLFEFLRREGLVEHHVELYQELELLEMVDRFFDKAVFYAAQAHERALRRKEEPAVVLRAR